MPIADPTAAELDLLQEEAVRLTQELIRVDTTNFGGNDPETWGKGEAEAAELVVRELREVGLEPEGYESAPGRPTVVVTIPGEDRERRTGAWTPSAERSATACSTGAGPWT